MGKVVKYCSACEEGFAEKFGFCPNCGSNLQAFEMNPLGNKPAEVVNTEPAATVETAAPPIAETSAEPINPPVAKNQIVAAEAAPTTPAETKEAFEFGDEVFEEPVAETKTFEATTDNSPNENINDNLYQATYAKTANEAPPATVPHYVPDTGYQPTIVVEKNVKQRNTLLLGAFVLGCTLMIGGYVYSMFNKFLDIAAIDTPDLLAYVGEVDPTQMEFEEPPPKKDDDEGGGGGGGGKDEQTPVNKGREAAQMPDPDVPPSAYMDKVTNPELTLRVGTVNKNPRPAENADMPYGLKNGGDTLSDGTGTGGGQGGGRGRGQGDGNGDGYGLGNGSGRGNGNGDGEGNGRGDGRGNPDDIQVVKKPVGPTEGVKILSKPRANYTDAARQNQVQGKVVLRVTFSANGSIGQISVISGLGNGLTEQAIAAARGIRFEPAKRAGVPYSVQKPVEYTFTIY
jgi:TonB family protein